MSPAVSRTSLAEETRLDREVAGADQHRQRGHKAGADQPDWAAREELVPERAGATNDRATTKGRPDNCAGVPGAPGSRRGSRQTETTASRRWPPRSRRERPQPQVAAVDLVRHSAGWNNSQTTALAATMAPEIQPLYLNNCARPTASPSDDGTDADWAAREIAGPCRWRRARTRETMHRSVPFAKTRYEVRRAR